MIALYKNHLLNVLNNLKYRTRKVNQSVPFLNSSIFLGKIVNGFVDKMH